MDRQAHRSNHKQIVEMYRSGNYTTAFIALKHGISVRQVQRIASKHGVIRTIDQSNKLMAKYKNYKTIPDDEKVKRKQITQRTRYIIISNHPYCTVCGMRPEDGVRLEVDHIDENPTNNNLENLQVLCTKCNTGKSHAARFTPDK